MENDSSVREFENQFGLVGISRMTSIYTPFEIPNMVLGNQMKDQLQLNTTFNNMTEYDTSSSVSIAIPLSTQQPTRIKRSSLQQNLEKPREKDNQSIKNERAYRQKDVAQNENVSPFLHKKSGIDTYLFDIDGTDDDYVELDSKSMKVKKQ